MLISVLNNKVTCERHSH